jgi:hypothetical protein
MWKDVNLEQLAEEDYVDSPPRPPDEVEAITAMAWWELYNRGLPCGMRPLRKRLRESYHLRPLPSEQALGQIVERHGVPYRERR